MPAKATIERIAHVGPKRALGPGVANRFVVEPGDLRANSPFVLLVEDFIEPQGDFHEHPHRGLETVTFILSGAMEHGDHLGNGGTLEAGDVQWMTAGSGIIHGGRPVEGSTVHGLQLWLNLPNALRKATPGTRVQRRDAATLETQGSVTIRTYGTHGRPPWSRQPITLRDVECLRGGQFSLAIAGGERCFLYVLAGAPRIGGRNAQAGEVLWCSVSAEAAQLDVKAADGFRLVVYSGRPIEEGVVARGPFVAGSEAELARDFADLRGGRIVKDGALTTDA